MSFVNFRAQTNNSNVKLRAVTCLVLVIFKWYYNDILFKVRD
jgi:hypothetical protein